MSIRSLSCVLSFTFSIFLATSLLANPHFKALTEGVRQLPVTGSVGLLIVTGKDSFPVATGKFGKTESQLPLAAAGLMGKGRVVALAHNGYLHSQEKDNPVLMRNAIKWLGSDRQDIRIGQLYTRSKLLVNRKPLTIRAKSAKQLAESLKKIDVLIMDGLSLNDPKSTDTIQQFVKDGGGLMVTSIGWVWKVYRSKGRSLSHEYEGNRLLADAGIFWGDGSLKSEGQFTISSEVPMGAHAGQGLALLEKHKGKAVGQKRPKFKGKLKGRFTGGSNVELAGKLAQAATTLSYAATHLPPNDQFLLPKLTQLANDKTPYPSKQTPANLTKDRLRRVILAMQTQQALTLPAEKLKAHPAAADFPGLGKLTDADKIDRLKNEKRTIDLRTPGWHSLGLYALPGEIIEVKFPKNMVGKVNLRIGCHKDKIEHHDSWRRMPQITRQYKVNQQDMHAACSFGGLVYIDVSKKLSDSLKQATKENTVAQVTLSNVIAAPLFIRGQHTNEDWLKVRHHPGPWAEFGSDKVVVTVPSHHIRNLDDPEALMKIWDDVMDHCADLAAIPRERPRPERFVPDRQISAGYMHSGYPIMTLMDQQEKLANAPHLKEGNWGYFHELGHNHQKREWTFTGTGEVTCNLFTSYVYEKVCGITPDKHKRTDAKARAKQIAMFNKLPLEKRFETWKSKPFLALTMYIQMQDEFGWEPFKKVFAEYQTLSKDERPKSDDQRRDQWMVRFSREVKRNLGPFFDTWHIPVSEEAKKSISDLPVWVHPEMQTGRDA